ncbi:MAG: hypothetical protein B6I24_06325 [Bacteroidetes bacterium 4572_128]|nr:MAG: hypothetical protein B6I24_06325 [Bacteroidetes bacterium 4572_128]
MSSEKAKNVRAKGHLRTFLNKAMFNGGEVDYLTVKHNNLFHIFYCKDVINVFGDNLEICNSKARKGRTNETSEQKVLFKYNGKI